MHSCGSFVAGGAIRGNARLILDRVWWGCGDARGARSGVSARLSCLGSVRASGTRRPAAATGTPCK